MQLLNGYSTNSLLNWHRQRLLTPRINTLTYFNSTLPTLLKTDPKKFWHTVNPKQTNSVPALKSADGSLLSLSECAETLNNHFSTVFTEELPINESLNLAGIAISHPFSEIAITANGVACAINRLSPSTSPGPDGITKLLELTIDKSSFFLALIFQQSLDSGCIPDWRIAELTSIFKSGDSSSPCNYRPISITSVCCKILEHILYSQIMTHLNLNNLLESQHGFRRNRSCQTQLFELITDLHTSLHSSYIDAIFIDMSKAFDRVPHKRLMLKIRNLQLDLNTTRWIEAFLNNRTQSVKINNFLSKSMRVKSRVPKGSVLGPLLFLIYINDIANIDSHIRLFADDCGLQNDS